MSKARRRLKARSREVQYAKHGAGRKRDQLCPNGCGSPGPHFVPPSLGEPGFFHCTPLEKQ